MTNTKHFRRSRVMSISLPKYLYDYVREVVEDKKFASTSEFMRYLLHLYREKKLRRYRDISHQEKLEAGQYKMKKHFEDIKLLSQLIANSIVTSKEAGEFETEID